MFLQDIGDVFFPFVNGLYHFLTVDATFSRDRCDIFSRLSYKRQIIRFWIVLERTALKPKFNFYLNLWKGIGSPVIEITVKKDSLSVYVIKFFQNFGITDQKFSKCLKNGSDRLRKRRLHRRRCDNHIVKDVLKLLCSNVNKSGKIAKNKSQVLSIFYVTSSSKYVPLPWTIRY